VGHAKGYNNYQTRLKPGVTGGDSTLMMVIISPVFQVAQFELYAARACAHHRARLPAARTRNRLAPRLPLTLAPRVATANHAFVCRLGPCLLPAPVLAVAPAACAHVRRRACRLHSHPPLAPVQSQPPPVLCPPDRTCCPRSVNCARARNHACCLFGPCCTRHNVPARGGAGVWRSPRAVERGVRFAVVRAAGGG
jgi:hypothetical protein